MQLFVNLQKKMSKKVTEINKRKKTMSSLKNSAVKVKKLKEYNYEDLMENKEIMKTLARRHSWQQYDKGGDMQKAFKNMS